MRGRFARIQLTMARRDAPYAGPFTGIHTTGGTSSTDVVESALSAQSLYFVPQTKETMARGFPEVELWNASWLMKARLGITAAAGDVFTNGIVAFILTATPVTQYGFTLAPAEWTRVPATSITQAGYRAPLWIFGMGA